MMLRTLLADLLGIHLPIIQAPIGSASCPELAAAVSNAGGLGMLALSWHGLEAARRAIRETRALTDRPFGVNLVLQWDQAERLEACLEERAPIVSFSWGDPEPYLARTGKAKVKVMHTVASAAEARRVADSGSGCHRRARLGGWRPRSGASGDHGSGASRRRCGRAHSCSRCGRHRRRTRAGCSVGAWSSQARGSERVSWPAKRPVRIPNIAG